MKDLVKLPRFFDKYKESRFRSDHLMYNVVNDTLVDPWSETNAFNMLESVNRFSSSIDWKEKKNDQVPINIGAL